jgi:hypothetical protein
MPRVRKEVSMPKQRYKRREPTHERSQIQTYYEIFLRLAFDDRPIVSAFVGLITGLFAGLLFALLFTLLVGLLAVTILFGAKLFALLVGLLAVTILFGAKLTGWLAGRLRDFVKHFVLRLTLWKDHQLP